jgi:S-adenosylmethionine-diacylglycerol 3-amino-3-carboxypropyl transferase
VILPKRIRRSAKNVNNDTNIPQADFSFVRYANCWEDAALLVRALRPTRAMRILSIASAGDNSLALLASGAEVVAVDLNPSQLACAELRREAIRSFEHPEFLEFAGITPSHTRLKMYHAIRPLLSYATQTFWDAHAEIVENGFIHAGKFERYFQLFRKYVIPLIHSRHTVNALLQPKSPEARRAFYGEVWDNRRWRLLFRLFFSKFLMGRLGRDPAFFQHVEGNVSTRILTRAGFALSELDNSANPYLSYILTGNYQKALPHYLHPENYRSIRQNLDRLTLRQGSVDDVAKDYGAAAFDGFNLSDIFEYLTPAQCEEVYGQLLASARPGARLAYWNMLVPRQCPSALAERVTSLDEEANRLFEQDLAFFYSRFVLEEVK